MWLRLLFVLCSTGESVLGYPAGKPKTGMWEKTKPKNDDDDADADDVM
jgi:hypothetical protein